MTRPSSPSSVLLTIAYLGFVSLGLPDTVIGVAWPSVREAFHLPQAAVAVIFLGTGLSYFLSSFFTGQLVRTLGMGMLLASSSALVAASAFGYAAAPTWGAFAACSLLHGLGSGAIDGGLNHFAAHHFSARHMNWLHAAYSLGAALGPVIMTSLLTQQRSWRAGYVTVAVGLASLATLFVTTSGRWTVDPPNPAPDTAQAKISLLSVLRVPLVWLQMLAFFVYTGLELTLGQWTFTVLTEARHVPAGRAGTLVAGYWVSILAGRVLFGFVVDRLGIDRLLRLSIGAATAGAALLTASPAQPLAALGLALCGLGLAPVFPCLMTRTPPRLGSAVSVHAIGMQVGAAMVGAATLPSLAGVLAQWCGLEATPAAALAMALILLCLHELLLHRGAAAQP